MRESWNRKEDAQMLKTHKEMLKQCVFRFVSFRSVSLRWRERESLGGLDRKEESPNGRNLQVRWESLASNCVVEFAFDCRPWKAKVEASATTTGQPVRVVPETTAATADRPKGHALALALASALASALAV